MNGCLVCLVWMLMKAKEGMSIQASKYPHQRLVKDILEHYDNRVRPVTDPKNAVNVTFRMELYQIIELSEASQSVTLYMWIIESWHDQFIYWRPEKYDGLDTVVVPAESIWRPDTYLYNSINMGEDRKITSVVIHMEPEPFNRNGALVKLSFPALMHFTCNMFLLHFPFDTQNCSLEFASWVYDKTGIDYYPESISVHMDNYIPSSEWVVRGFLARRVVKSYKCCPNPFVSLYYNFVVSRKPLFYVLNLVIPTLIIGIIAMVGFFFPSKTAGDREEKVSLGISTLLSMSVFLLMVSDSMPTTSDFVPYIGWFYIGMILFIAAATLVTSLMIVLQQQGRYGRRIPPWLRRVAFERLARVVLLRMPRTVEEELEQRRTKNVTDKSAPGVPNGVITRKCSLNLHENGVISGARGLGENGIANIGDNLSSSGMGNFDLDNLDGVFARLYSGAHELVMIHQAEQAQAKLELEWEWLAGVLEQLALTIFLVALAIFAYLILYSNPPDPDAEKPSWG